MHEALEDRRFAGVHAEFGALLDLLDAKVPTVTRFVRVACPARGTTLASGRLDRWLSVLGLLAPPGFAADLTDFLLKVVKERTDPRSLPGLEAMMPQSSLTRLLHLPGLVTHADLSVISGDLDPQGRWGRLKLLALDWFYSSDHDLVVNTGSMSGGVERAAGCARQRHARGPAVHHFSYFSNARFARMAAQRPAPRRYRRRRLTARSSAGRRRVEPRSRAAMRASRVGRAPTGRSCW